MAITRTYNYKDKETYADKPEGTSHNVYDNSNVSAGTYTPDINLDIFGYLEQLRKTNIPLQSDVSIIKALENAKFTAPQKKGDVISIETVQKIKDYLTVLQKARNITSTIANSIKVPTKDETLLEGGIFNKNVATTVQDGVTIYTDSSTSTRNNGGASDGSIYSDWIKTVHQANISTINAGHTSYRSAYVPPAANAAYYATDCPTWKTSVNSGYKSGVKTSYNISNKTGYGGNSQGACSSVAPCTAINYTNHTGNKIVVKNTNKASYAPPNQSTQ